MTVNGDHYTYRVRWSGHDEAYIATVAEMPSLSWADDHQAEALEHLRELVDDVIEDMARSGEVPPEAIADRSYSGKFMVRLTPEAHR